MAGKFIPDRDDDEIREWYDQIMKNEGVLADIGTCAFSEVIATGVDHGLLDNDFDRTTPPREILDVLKLFRRRLRRPQSEETIWFRQVGRELGRRPDDLFCRRCVELPQYFEVLHFHRNKRAHRGEVTRDSLCAFAGAVLGILELSSDAWVDTKRLDDAARRALAWATDSTNRESAEDESRLRREAELQKLRIELQELRAEGPQSHAAPSDDDPEIVKRALTSTKAHITKKVNEAKGEMQRRLEQVGDAIASLRSEVLDAQEHGQPPVGEEEADAVVAPSQTRPQLTGGQARTKLQDAFRRMRDTRGVDTSANVFQHWIVDEALKWAATGKMDQIEDWWKLPSVQRKALDEKEQMREQLQIPEVEDWMMDIYRRVERRPDSR